EPAAAAQIAASCGYLPLALRIVGARLAAKPHWRIQRLADRLAAHHRRLDELTVGDLEVRASFALSYPGGTELERRAVRPLRPAAGARLRALDAVRPAQGFGQ